VASDIAGAAGDQDGHAAAPSKPSIIANLSLMIRCKRDARSSRLLTSPPRA
jgi:hypothetical protein